MNKFESPIQSADLDSASMEQLKMAREKEIVTQREWLGDIRQEIIDRVRELKAEGIDPFNEKNIKNPEVEKILPIYDQYLKMADSFEDPEEKFLAYLGEYTIRLDAGLVTDSAELKQMDSRLEQQLEQFTGKDRDDQVEFPDLVAKIKEYRSSIAEILGK